MKGRVQTVLGPIAPADMGVTITHEHILSTMPHLTDTPPEDPQRRAFFDEPVTMENLGTLRFGSLLNYDNCQLDSIETAIDEVSRFGRAGGGTIVEATSLGIGRNPAGLARISEASGVSLIMGSSYYLGITHPPERNVAGRDEEDIADEIVRDVTEGADGTSIRAGLIGEVGCSSPMTDDERKVLRASAQAQRRTGAPLMTHPSPPRESPMEIVRVLEAAGADLSRTIMCHLDRTIDTRDALEELARTGCVMEYDLFGYENSYYPYPLRFDMPTDARRADWIAWLFERGYGDRVVISHDVIFKNKLARYGGHGYAHIIENVVPLMRRKGFRQSEIDAMLVDTPRRLFTFV